MTPDDQEELENSHDQELEHIGDNFQNALKPGEHQLENLRQEEKRYNLEKEEGDITLTAMSFMRTLLC